MYFNGETISALICLIMGLVLLIQYISLFPRRNFLHGILYFVLLAVSGLPWLYRYAASLRLAATSMLLVLAIGAVGHRHKVKDRALLKIPFFVVMLGAYFAQDTRMIMTLDGIMALIMAWCLWRNRETQGLRFRYFIKTTILGMIYLGLKIGFSHIPAVGWGAMVFKVFALYYLYCWVSSYLSQDLLGRIHDEN